MNLDYVLRKHKCKNINAALKKLLRNNDVAYPKKPLCKKCNREVDFFMYEKDTASLTYVAEIKCHGEEESVQGEIIGNHLLDTYVFEK